MVENHYLLVGRRRRLPNVEKAGRAHGINSGLWLPSNITMLVAIFWNFRICASMVFLPLKQHNGRYFVGSNGQICNPSSSVSSSSSTSLRASSSESSWMVRTRLGRTDAQSLLDSPEFLPSLEYGDRIGFGHQAAEKELKGNNDEEVGIMMADDPRLARKYAEFPLSSLDILLDMAVQYFPAGITNSNSTVNMVDIGSGLGRIVLYSALTRGSSDNDANWKVRGIEISSSLHNKALELVQTGVDREIFEDVAIEDSDSDSDSDSDDPRSATSDNSISFQCGSVTDEIGKELLKNAHLVFAYSTAFKGTAFDPDVGALLLDTEEWSLPLSEACRDGCVVVTTDKALNPNLGWKIVDRLDVPNPEVFGTTGFIHILQKEISN